MKQAFLPVLKIKPVLALLAPSSKIETEAGIAKLSAIGIGMHSHSGVAAINGRPSSPQAFLPVLRAVRS